MFQQQEVSFKNDENAIDANW